MRPRALDRNPGGVRAIYRATGADLFLPMTTPEEYETQIAALMAMNLKLQIELTKALEAVAEARRGIK